jgi:hypothetical protein
MAATKLVSLALAASLLLVALVAAPVHAAVDVATCGGIVQQMGGGAGLMSMAPNCNPQGGSFSIGSCCGQIKALINASGPDGAACMCEPSVFATFSAQVSIPGFSNSAIPAFLGNICRIPVAGNGC